MTIINVIRQATTHVVRYQYNDLVQLRLYQWFLHGPNEKEVKTKRNDSARSTPETDCVADVSDMLVPLIQIPVYLHIVAGKYRIVGERTSRVVWTRIFALKVLETLKMPLDRTID